MNKILGFCFATLVAGSFLSSCKKDNELPNTFNEDQQVNMDQNQADNEAEDVSNLEDQVMDANESVLMNGRLAADSGLVRFLDSNNCATVTIIPKGTNPTGKVTVDFGTGCLCKDGRTRKGKISWTFTDKIRKQGAVVVTSYQDYGVTKRGATEFVMIDNNSSKTTTNTSSPAILTDNAVIRITREINMAMKFEDGQSFVYQGNKVMEWNLGLLGNKWDNIQTTLVGSGLAGTDRKGRNYTMTVNSNVVRKSQCAYMGIYKPVSGVITITHDSKTKVVDFGDGNCDSNVDVTISGKKTRTRW